ncbi:MAG: hypothetical protein OXN17_16870 [Candidatus Poribacteria bacterium]|nr:hypothetical protein [Candidatus Poribacteria bacterium]
MKFFALSIFLIWGCFAIGCLTSPLLVGPEKTPSDERSVTSERVEEVPVEDAFVARLHVSSPKPAYQASEPIPVQIAIETGTFDLLVSHATVESDGLLPMLVVTNQNGKILVPKNPIAFESEMKELVRDGKKVDCVKGIKLIAGTGQMVSIKNIQNHYALAPGVYTLQVSLDLSVYKETLTAESIPIHDAQQRIGRVQAKSRIAAHTREKHVAGLKMAINALEIQAEELDEIYLPIDSLRGVVELKSNLITLEIQEPS